MVDTAPRTGKALIDASRPFAHDDRRLSWFHVGTTLAVLIASIAVAASAPWWPLRLVGGLIEAGTLVRLFILYHDYMHGAILRGSRIARPLFASIGVLMLNPPRAWNDTHNFHHANTARLAAPATGTFVLWTVERWRSSSFWERLAYRLERHPVTMFFAQVTVFFFGMSVLPFVKNPRRYASGALAAVLHVALSAAVWELFGANVYLSAMLAPMFIACMLGAYLFYAQHNAPGITIRPDEEWSHAEGAIEGSTFLATGPVLQWFTGNIGYHHVHHLNARIPFYRLPEAMAAVDELQHPIVTTLRPRDVIACLGVDLWDPARARMVSYAEAADRSAVPNVLSAAA